MNTSASPHAQTSALTSLSTCWRTRKHKGIHSLVEETHELGFRAIELSHGLPVSWLPETKKLVQQGELVVSGVHNFCPAPVEVTIDAPDIYEITHYRAFVRQRAMNQTKKTLAFAAEVGAQYCVFHAGSVPMKKSTDELEKLALSGQLHNRKYVQKKLQMVRQRERLGKQLYDRVRSSLETIATWAEEFGVPVGIESRSHFEQFPTTLEMRQLMADFAENPWIGYWHDFGHVQRQHNLGLVNHQQWLEEMSPFLLGGHLHDVAWPKKDHRVPLTADMNYDQLMPLFPKNRWLVWELSPSCSKSDLQLSTQAWQLKYTNMRRETNTEDKAFTAFFPSTTA